MGYLAVSFICARTFSSWNTHFYKNDHTVFRGPWHSKAIGHLKEYILSIYPQGVWYEECFNTKYIEYANFSRHVVFQSAASWDGGPSLLMMFYTFWISTYFVSNTTNISRTLLVVASERPEIWDYTAREDRNWKLLAMAFMQWYRLNKLRHKVYTVLESASTFTKSISYHRDRVLDSLLVKKLSALPVDTHIERWCLSEWTNSTREAVFIGL